MGRFQEAEKRVLISMTNPRLYDAMKEALSKYVEDVVVKTTYVSNSTDLLPSTRVAYGSLAEDAELYFYPFEKVQEAIERLDERERVFIDMYYGLRGSKFTETEVAEKLGITVPIEDYKEETIKSLIRNLG